MTFVHGLAGVALALGLAARVAAQEPSPLLLKPATGSIAGGFVYLTSVHELADRRVVLAESGQKRIVVADFRSSKVRRVGRNGSGPGEYLFAYPVLPWRGDSGLMIDRFAHRMILFSGASIVGSVPPEHPAMAALRGDIGGTDGSGHILTVMRGHQRSDSESLVLTTFRNGHQDTLGHIPPDTLVAKNRVEPYGVPYAAAVAALDGWVAVRYAAPYRVDWRSPTGVWTRGAPIPFNSVRLDRAEKMWAMIRIARGSPPEPVDSVRDWPSYVPPVVSWALPMIAGDGNVVVARTPYRAQPGNVYDVINRAGIRIRSVALPPNARILGFGKASVYVIVSDEDDLQTLERHPWP